MKSRTKIAGYVNPMIVPLVMSVILVLVLGFTTYKYYNDYNQQKNEVDAIVSQAVEEAKDVQAKELEVKHQEELKSPYETYEAPAQYNAIAVTYPRNWSSYVEEDSDDASLNGYFHPGTVHDTGGENKFALRMTLEQEDYADEVEDYQKDVEKGEIDARAITVNGVDGVRLTGVIDRDINGVMVILPIRDKVLKIWTETNAYADDFNNIIVENLSFDR